MSEVSLNPTEINPYVLVQDKLEKEPRMIPAMARAISERLAEVTDTHKSAILQSLNSNFVQAVLSAHEILEPRSAQKVISTTSGVVGPIFERLGEDWQSCKYGLTAEVAAIRALKKGSYEVVPASNKEDTEGAIDLIATTRDPEALIAAIQVKTGPAGMSPQVIALADESGIRALPVAQRKIAQRMMRYISVEGVSSVDASLQDKIVPVLIILPGGSRSITGGDVSSFSRTTGEPSQELVDVLGQQLEEILYSNVPEAA